MHLCNTHKNERSVRAVSVLQKNVRSTGECVYKIVTGFFFIWIFSKRVERCEEDGLSSLVSYSHQCVLEHEYTSKNFWSLRSTRTSPYYFLHARIESQSFFGRNFALLDIQMLSAILDPNELLRKFLAILDRGGAPIS